MVPLLVTALVIAVFASITVVEVAFVERFARHFGLPPSIDLILAIAVLATAGYGAFWMYLLHPTVGVIGISLFWLGSFALATRRVARTGWPRLNTEFVLPLALTLSSALLSLGLLLLYRRPEALAEIATRRFTSQQLPADNILPQLFADRLLNGESPRALFGDWLSSDRPPLATGWILLFQQPFELVGVSRTTAYFVGAFTFQITWVAGLWAVLRSSRVGQLATSVAVLFTAFTSVTLINSVFTWPKLSAGAFTLAAWALIVSGRHVKRSGGILCAAFLTLAMLSHGAAAFAIVATALILGFGWLRRRDRHQLNVAAWALGASALIYAPWFAYQRWYEPPGDRLVKWHLAGVIPIDDRSAVETLTDVYRDLSFGEWVDLKRSNITVLFQELIELDRWTDPSAMRTNEFFFLFAGMGLAGLLWLAVPALPILVAGSRTAAIAFHSTWRFASLALATLAVTIVMLFGPQGTIIHQIPYVIPLSMTAVPIAFIASTSRRIGLLLLAMQGLWFIVTWAPASPGQGGPISYGAIGLLLLSACGTLASIAYCWHSANLEHHEPTESEPSLQPKDQSLSPAAF